MVTDHLTERMGSLPNLPIKRSVSIRTMLNFDGDGHGHGHGDNTCKQSRVCLFRGGGAGAITNDAMSHYKRQGQEAVLLRQVNCTELHTEGYSPYCFWIRRQHSIVHPGTRSFQVRRVSETERDARTSLS